MKVKLIGDSKFEGSADFSIEVKNGKIYFRIGKDKHVFGSKVYPVGSRGFSIFAADGVKGDYHEVAAAIERGNWVHRNGYCYTNAEILHQAFLGYGIDAKYYSGWIFAGATYPVHHAWVVVDDKVYDISIHVPSTNKIMEQKKNGKDPYSAGSVKEVKALKHIIYPIHENFIWGDVGNTLIYVGSEETPESARLKYNTAMSKIPNHPSHRLVAKKVGNETHFKTRYQHLMDED